MKGTILAQRIAKDGLYKLLSQEESIHSSSVQLSEPSSMMSIISFNNNVTSVQASNSDFCLESKSLVSFQTSGYVSANILHSLVIQANMSYKSFSRIIVYCLLMLINQFITFVMLVSFENYISCIFQLLKSKQNVLQNWFTQISGDHHLFYPQMVIDIISFLLMTSLDIIGFFLWY